VETITEQAANLRMAWETDQRWNGIRRDHTAQDVIRLRTNTREHPVARRGARRLWELLQAGDVVRPDQALHPVNPVRPDGRAFERTKSAIAAGAAGVQVEDLLPPAQDGGFAGGKVLIPTGQHIRALQAARLAADVLDVPALVIARTSAHAAALLTSDTDERDHEFLTGERTADGFYRVRPSLYAGVTRGLAFAPYADLLWLETGTPDLAAARAFAAIIHSQYPDKLLAYSCAPAFGWRGEPGDLPTARFQRELAAMGYRFQSLARPAVPALDETEPELESLAGAAATQFALS
jgi:isocitrate lyase